MQPHCFDQLNRLPNLFGQDRLGWTAAIAARALILESLRAHQGLQGVIATSAIGAVMAVVYVLFGKRLLPMIIGHSAINTIILLVLLIQDDGVDH